MSLMLLKIYSKLIEWRPFDLDEFNMLVTDDDAKLDDINLYIDTHPGILTYVDPVSKNSILHLAVSDASPERLEYLLKKGANVHINTPDEDGNTPLHIAAEWIKVESVPVLLKYGADKFAKNNMGLNPPMYCIYKKQGPQFKARVNEFLSSLKPQPVGGMRRTRRRKATRRSRAKSQRQRKARRY